MDIILSPKDTTDRIVLHDVSITWQEGLFWCIRFKDGSIRRYPMQHIWYVEAPAPITV